MLGLGGSEAAAQDDPGRALERHRPLLLYDAGETYFAQPVSRPHAEPRRIDRDLIYGHLAEEDGRTWLQYWLFFANNSQDRGIVRTGRHEGDWELLQLRLGPDGEPDLATLSQHSSAEGCGWGELELAEGGDVPVVYVASGSHALYPRAGTADRPFPDPNDEAGGEGREVRPEVEPVRASRPGWVAYEGLWGGSRAGIVPGEQSSPPGPLFQPSQSWSRPGAYHEAARPCGAGPPGRWWALPALALMLAAIAGAVVLLIRRHRR